MCLNNRKVITSWLFHLFIIVFLSLKKNLLPSKLMAANLFAEIIVHTGHYPLGSLLLVWTILKDWIKVPYTHYLSLIYAQLELLLKKISIYNLYLSGRKSLTVVTRGFWCTVTSAGFTVMTNRLLQGKKRSKTLKRGPPFQFCLLHRLVHNVVVW